MTAHPSSGHRWKAHPWLAGGLQALILLTPVVVACLVTGAVATRWRPTAHRVWWVVALCVLGCAVGMVVERLVRRYTPLATLLRLTMLFPDRAPSRMKVARSAGDSRRLVQRLASSDHDSTGTVAEKVLALITALGNHDRKTRGHSERVRLFADLLGDELRLPERDRDRLRWAALLHDIGKLTIAPAVLNKPERLDADELDLMKQHPLLGAELAAPLLSWLGEWGNGIVEHHERFDGEGYPRGLGGREISPSGRILNVVDSFETMTAARAYKKPMATRAAREELARCAGSQFDPDYVRAFLAISLPRLLLAMGPVSALVQLPFLRSIAQAGAKASALGGQATAGLAAGAAGVAGVVGVATVTAAGTLAPLADAADRRPLARGPVSRAHLPTTVPARSPGPGARVSLVAPRPAPRTTADPAPSVAPKADGPARRPPESPSAINAVAGEGSATVSWTTPASDGGSSLTGFTVTPYVGSTPLPSVTVGPGVTNSIVPGLVNGTAYSFTVVATNAVGSSPAATSPEVTPAGVPRAPGTPVAVAGDASAALSWSRPSDNGRPLTGFTITPRDGTRALPAVTVGPTTTTATIAGLTNGTSYTFDVRATNGAGTSPPSVTNPVTPVAPPLTATAPDAPRSPTVVAGSRSATVSWTPPSSVGGSPVTGYTVAPYDGAVALAAVRVGPAATVATVTGLANGTTYTFQVTATNAGGTSAAAATGPVTPATTPDAPTAPEAIAGDGSAHVSWSAPALDGGNPLTGYVVTPYRGPMALDPVLVAPAVTTTTIGGLTNGADYSFRIAAVNAVGPSPTAVTPTVIPAAVPLVLPPTAVVARSDNASATVSWTAPLAPLVVDSYLVSAFRYGALVATRSVAAPEQAVIVTGLSNGTAYTFTVTAQTPLGASAASAPSAPVVPAAPRRSMRRPGDPRNVVAVPAVGSVTLSWSPAPALGGQITSYLVTVFDAQDQATGVTRLVAADATSVTLSGLLPGEQYRFLVQATNVVGSSSGVKTPKILVL